MNSLRIFLMAALILVVLGSGNSEGEIIDTSDESFNLVTNYLNVCYDENTTCEIIDVIMSNNGKYALTLDDEGEFTAVNLETMSIIFDIKAYSPQDKFDSVNYGMLFSFEGNAAWLSFKVSDEQNAAQNTFYIDFNDGNYSLFPSDISQLNRCTAFSEISKFIVCGSTMYYFGNGHIEEVSLHVPGVNIMPLFWNNGTTIGVDAHIIELSVVDSKSNDSENNESAFSLNVVTIFPCSPFSSFQVFFEMDKYVFCHNYNSENYTLYNFGGEEIGTIVYEGYKLLYVSFDDELTIIGSHTQQGVRAKVYNITDLSFISETFISNDEDDWQEYIEGRFHYAHYKTGDNYCASYGSMRCPYYTNSSFLNWELEEIELLYSLSDQMNDDFVDNDYRGGQVDNYYPIISEKGIYYCLDGGFLVFTTLEPILEEDNEKEVDDESSLPSVPMIPALISIGLIAIYRRK